MKKLNHPSTECNYTYNISNLPCDQYTHSPQSTMWLRVQPLTTIYHVPTSTATHHNLPCDHQYTYSPQFAMWPPVQPLTTVYHVTTSTATHQSIIQPVHPHLPQSTMWRVQPLTTVYHVTTSTPTHHSLPCDHSTPTHHSLPCDQYTHTCNSVTCDHQYSHSPRCTMWPSVHPLTTVYHVNTSRATHHSVLSDQYTNTHHCQPCDQYTQTPYSLPFN